MFGVYEKNDLEEILFEIVLEFSHTVFSTPELQVEGFLADASGFLLQPDWFLVASGDGRDAF